MGVVSCLRTTTASTSGKMFGHASAEPRARAIVKIWDLMVAGSSRDCGGIELTLGEGKWSKSCRASRWLLGQKTTVEEDGMLLLLVVWDCSVRDRAVSASVTGEGRKGKQANDDYSTKSDGVQEVTRDASVEKQKVEGKR